MGTAIRGKSQIATALGTEAIPVNTALNADGWMTAQQIANLAAASSGGLPVYNVRSAPYNAVGNGVANDSVACQSAINACAAGGGGIVFFPTGTYLLSTAGLTVSTSSIMLMGAGQYATFVCVPHNALYPAITLQGNSGSRNTIRHQVVRGMSVMMGTTLAGSGAASSGTTPGIKVMYGVHQYIEDTNVFFFQTGIYVGPQTNNFRTRTVHIACFSATATCYGIFVDNAGNSLGTEDYSTSISFTDIDQSGAAGTKYGIYVGNGGGFQDFFVDHSETDNCTYGIFLDGSGATAGYLTSDCQIDHVRADQCVYGVYVNAANALGGGQVDIDGCYFSSASASGTGVYVTNSTGVHVRGLQVQGAQNGGEGAQFISSSDCSIANSISGGNLNRFVTVSGSYNVKILGNSITTLTSGAISLILITGGTHDVSITDNSMRCTGGTISNGIVIAAGTGTVTMLGNHIEAATITVPLSNAGTSCRGVANPGIADF